MTDINPSEAVKSAISSKANIILDASKIDLFETCPARYNFRHNHNKTLPVIQKSRSLDLGGIIHEGFAVYYRLLQENRPYAERIEACMMKIREVSSDPTISNSNPDDINDLLLTIEQNLDYWRAEDENCLEILAVEEPFAYVLFEDAMVRVIISGKIDLLVNYHGIGQAASYDKVPIDHKSFSKDGPILRKSNQFVNYCEAVDSNYLIVNRVGLHDPKARTPKPAEEKFKRVPLSYDPVYKKDWRDNLTKMISLEYLTCLANDTWVEKPTSCNKFNRLCEYFAICDSSGQDSKDFKLESEYVTAEQWDVTKNLVLGEN